MSDETAVQTSALPGGVYIISLSRPHRRNAVDSATAKLLYKAFLDFELDEDQKVCVFYGKNGTFCAGADLHELAHNSEGNNDRLVPVQDGNLGPMGPSRLRVKKPVIAAISGHAVAGGLELSLLADIRVVEESAILGVFCRRWGVPLIDGGTVRLQKIIGLGRAMDLILTGRPVGAEEALAMGLANRVVPEGKSLDEAINIAKQLIEFPQLCMNIDRDSVYYTAYDAVSFEDAMQYEFLNGRKAVSAEGVAGAGNFKAGAGRHGASATANTSQL